jgi:RNA polymerase sigma-70 factor (ECF subfamily)
MCEKKKPASAGDASDSWSARRDALEGTMSRDGEQRTMARDAIQHGLLLLSEEQREAVVLFHQLEWPIRLIAEHMGLPEGTVKSHLHRGRMRLREELVRGVGEVVAIEQRPGSVPMFAKRSLTLEPRAGEGGR